MTDASFDQALAGFGLPSVLVLLRPGSWSGDDRLRMEPLARAAEEQRSLVVVLRQEPPAGSADMLPNGPGDLDRYIYESDPSRAVEALVRAVSVAPGFRLLKSAIRLRAPPAPLSIGALRVLRADATVTANRRAPPPSVPSAPEARSAVVFDAPSASAPESDPFDDDLPDYAPPSPPPSASAPPEPPARAQRMPSASPEPSPSAPAFVPLLQRAGWVLAGAASLVALYHFRQDLGTVTSFFMKWFTTMPPTPAAMPGAPTPGPVDVSAFGPPEIERGGEAFIQVLLHRPDDAARAAARAREGDPEAERRSTATLLIEIAEGQHVTILLDAPGASLDEPVQELVWRGVPQARAFVVTAPGDTRKTAFNVSAIVSVDGRPAGSVRFRLPVVDADARIQAGIHGDHAGRFERIFISYATPDRLRVLDDAQLLKAARHEVFTDLLSLEPGASLREEIFPTIATCDLFLLYWSTHARNSDWVRRETDFALRIRSESRAPDIVPMILEGPPVPLPPPEWGWSDINFNDKIRFIRFAVEAMQKQAGGPGGSGGSPPPVS